MKNDIYKVELVVGETIVYTNEHTRERDIYTALIENLPSEDLFPNAIMTDVTEKGMAACWCGSNGYGYKIARVEEDNKLINYVFNS